MTFSKPLKSGEILVPKAGSAFKSWTQVKLMQSKYFKGQDYWWLEMMHKDGSTHLDTLSLTTLRSGWERKPSFFRVGVKYRFPRERADTWEILEIRQVDNPQPWSGKLKAISKMVTTEGYEDIQALSENDFRRMVEA